MERRPRDPEVRRHLFQDDGRLPNNPKLPLLVYLGALFVYDDLSSECEAWSGENGWGGAWRGRVFTYHLYHSTAHEVLGIVRVTARPAFDGESVVALELEIGDVAVIAAGMGQCNPGAGGGFLVVGAYPRGQSWELRTGEPGERPEVLENMRRVTRPGVDPVFGNEGPLAAYWVG
jgi:uncharacterized protein YjlB